MDPDSEAHDLVMSLYGGMSKGERNRIKVRVRTAMASQAATEGRYLGGRPLYGYQLADAGAHPNPAKAADGKRKHRLEPDPDAAPVVQRIFAEYLDGRGLRSIAEALSADGIASPSAHDPARNRHRQHSGGAWAHSAVRAILHNPRYTGHQVWARQSKDEDLLDPEDVALGHRTRMRWNEKGEWIWSAEITHEPLIDMETFDQVQAIMASHVRVARPKTVMPTERAYLLRGLLFCGVCGRRMGGNYNHGRAHYRCTFREQYAQKKGVEQPPHRLPAGGQGRPRPRRLARAAVRPRQPRRHMQAARRRVRAARGHVTSRAGPPDHRRVRSAARAVPRSARRWR